MQEFLAAEQAEAGQTVNATKEKLGRDEALKLARSARRVVIARGKKVMDYDMRADPPDEETLAQQMLGPTGNLRAPTLRVGDTVLVGLNEEAFRPILTNSA